MPWRARARRSPAPTWRATDGGGAVGEEDAQADRRLEHARGDAEPGQLRGAEVADDRGVREQEQRLGDQREERGDRERQIDRSISRVSGCGGARGQPTLAKRHALCLSDNRWVAVSYGSVVPGTAVVRGLLAGMAAR